MRKFPLLLLLLSFHSFGQEGTKQQDNWKTLRTATYSIQYPPNWELKENIQNGAPFFLFSPLANTTDQFRENVNLQIEDLAGKNINLTAYAALSESQVKSIIKNGKILESNVRKRGNETFYKIIYTGDFSNLQLKFEQYYFVKNEKAFVLTLTCLDNEFLNYQAIGEQILNSFLIKSK